MRNAIGWSAIFFAAGKGHTEVVELLLRGGADGLTKDKMGQGPADVAEENGHGEVASLIRDWK